HPISFPSDAFSSGAGRGINHEEDPDFLPRRTRRARRFFKKYLKFFVLFVFFVFFVVKLFFPLNARYHNTKIIAKSIVIRYQCSAFSSSAMKRSRADFTN